MKARSVITYTLLRLAFFLVPLGIMMLFPAFWNMWWLAILFAGLIGVSLSIIFLQKPRSEFSEGLYERRRTTKSAREIDEDIENEANARLADETPREEDSVDR
ncbi:hypothetical protein GCM10010915_28280 [Microbacterium faecale]|uniref:DUF4229 domain-containing protein n=1 Tax=Microbacterium faecale TaxID=1804630 RepID=A0A917DK90_9MICO|nr:DUF4229 domain-containing protein [Microbacterium faecale]GGD45338.1 hypothetical protein GCM10010915_28280 [Microbacterium faecale]